MAETYTDDLLDGYNDLRETREWSVDTMADHIDKQAGDPALAAKYREKFGDDAPKKTPAKRRTKADAVTVEG